MYGAAARLGRPGHVIRARPCLVGSAHDFRFRGCVFRALHVQHAARRNVAYPANQTISGEGLDRRTHTPTYAVPDERPVGIVAQDDRLRSMGCRDYETKVQLALIADCATLTPGECPEVRTYMSRHIRAWSSKGTSPQRIRVTASFMIYATELPGSIKPNERN
jgi:hypothetical protein